MITAHLTMLSHALASGPSGGGSRPASHGCAEGAASPGPHGRAQRTRGFRIRLLGPADAAAYREIRLEGLRCHPCAFASSDAEEAARSPAEFAARLALENEPVFGALIGGELCGLAGLSMYELEKKRHKGTLRGVYVRPDARRAGLGCTLVGHVIEAARARVAQLHATVVVSNHPARALYRRLGFEPYGIEPRGLRVGDRFYDQELLVLRLE